jgi:CRP-like cAMP-binding protein
MSDPQLSPLDPEDLKNVPFLGGLGAAEKAALCLAAEVREVRAGEHVFRAGDSGRDLHVILAGEVAIELDTGGSEPTVLAALRQGTVFGEINFLLASQRTADARALHDTRLMCLSRDGLDALGDAGRQALAAVIEILSRILALRLANMDKELQAFARKLSEQHPEAAGLGQTLVDKRDLLMHEWSF